MMALPAKAMEPATASAKPPARLAEWGTAVRLETNSLPVAPRVAGGHIALDLGIARAPDELTGAEVLVQRGASQAACGFCFQSIIRSSVCRCPCGCMLPPITPKLICGLPSFIRNAGMIVWNGRLPGSTQFG